MFMFKLVDALLCNRLILDCYLLLFDTMFDIQWLILVQSAMHIIASSGSVFIFYFLLWNCYHQMSHGISFF